ncbi:hypothetical protein BDV30DRAFT_235282 [Aspergillus minisclerotigenes]|uniref:FAD-binding domain-containing protein n=1 Tax=Aspergillus minisclerotigenes TaxID=656917 RepID=A0A5N6JDU1_9EURO|nr:hypothetical protein BDV30DRAFT_235282 [Aspergillus minisclerotigenes]
MIARITDSPPPSQDGPPFRVIIVGAGVAGLTLAHCLDKAGIDYLVLDKGIVAPPFGTTITLQPHGCRILHQLGILDDVLDSCSTMGKCYYRTPDGHCFLENHFFPIVRKYAGYDTRTMNRQLFLRILYNRLPDKSKVLEHQRVVDIIEEEESARVVLADGTEYVGDLVVGADGAHSKVRKIMWKNANKTIPHFITAAEKRCTIPILSLKLCSKPIAHPSSYGHHLQRHRGPMSTNPRIGSPRHAFNFERPFLVPAPLSADIHFLHRTLQTP